MIAAYSENWQLASVTSVSAVMCPVEFLQGAQVDEKTLKERPSWLETSFANTRKTKTVFDFPNQLQRIFDLLKTPSTHPTVYIRVVGRLFTQKGLQSKLPWKKENYSSVLISVEQLLTDHLILISVDCISSPVFLRASIASVSERNRDY